MQEFIESAHLFGEAPAGHPLAESADLANHPKKKRGPKTRVIVEFPEASGEDWVDPPSFPEALALHMRRHGDSCNHLHRAIIGPGDKTDRKTIQRWATGAKAPGTIESLSVLNRIERRYRLVSPVDGTVAQLSVHTIGGVIESAKPLMVIVPKGGNLVAEVKLLNKDAEFVRAGQNVAVKLEAFPFTRFGTIPGHVETISSDAVEDERLGLVYAAHIRLDRAQIDGGDKIVPLTPGMAVTADIRTGERSIMSYLISPIDEVRQEAGAMLRLAYFVVKSFILNELFQISFALANEIY